MLRVQAQVEELPDSRVRLQVEVPSSDVKHAVQHAASDLAGSLKIPGFRKGKVPMPVLIARVGKARIYAEAVESHIAGWFLNAAATSRVHPVEQPQYEYEPPASDQQSFRFTATVAVQPKPDLPDWSTLEVPRAEAEVPDDLIEHELAILRSSVAGLVPVEGRPVLETDTVVIDLTSESETRGDYVVELGQGVLLEEIERGIVGMSAGETKELEFEIADDSLAKVTVTVKEIKEKLLPPLDDELARAASEFDTLAELRGDIESRLGEQAEERVEGAFRAAAVDRLVEAASVDPSGPLVETRTRELLNGFVRSVERRGLSVETYLQLTGGEPEQLVEQIRGEATRSVARELVLEAVADQLGIEVPDSEIDELVREQALAAGDDPEQAVEQTRESAVRERLREDLRLRTALDRVAAGVTPISVDLAAARDKLWTPEQEKTPTDTKLWTPGSKEPE